MAFFTLWWRDQTDAVKLKFKSFLASGRIEFVNGGWSMNDEACPLYSDIISNMMTGHQFLHSEFGVTPKIGWHVDPFGHSLANQYLFSEMGLEAIMFSRIDYQDKEKRMASKELEWVWETFSEDRGSNSTIFAHTMFHHYFPPPGFCWEPNNCGYYDEPIVNDRNLKTYNVE